jgi:hypothetical protein
MNEASTLEVNRTVQPWPSIAGGISPGPRHWNRFLVESQSGACWNTGAEGGEGRHHPGKRGQP